MVEIDSGVAVVAEDTWAAIKGREALAITWEEGSNKTLNSADLERDLISQATGNAGPKQGELAAVYIVPYLAHATLEPMNCVADVRSDRCEIWAPTQNPMAVKQLAISLTGLPAESVKVNVPLVLQRNIGRKGSKLIQFQLTMREISHIISLLVILHQPQRGLNIKDRLGQYTGQQKTDLINSQSRR